MTNVNTDYIREVLHGDGIDGTTMDPDDCIEALCDEVDRLRSERVHQHRPGGPVGCHHCRELTCLTGPLSEDEYAYVRRLAESWSTRDEDNTFLKLVYAYDALLTEVAALGVEVGVQVGANSVLLDALRAIASDGCRSPSASRSDEWICLDDWPDVPEEWCAGCVAHLVA